MVHLCLFALKSVDSSSKCVHKFGKRETKGWVETIVPCMSVWPGSGGGVKILLDVSIVYMSSIDLVSKARYWL